jgi:hypothetical protein
MGCPTRGTGVHDPSTECVVGTPYTRNVCALFVIPAPPRVTATAYAALLTDGVDVNVNVRPAFAVVSAVGATGAVATKSAAMPVTALESSATVTVHDMALPVRYGGPDEPHASTDDVVGLPNITYDKDPVVMTDAPILAVTTNADVKAAGVVANVNVAPPLAVVGVMDAALVDDTVKSDAIPVVATGPVLDTAIVHENATPARGFVPGLHVSLDNIVGLP